MRFCQAVCEAHVAHDLRHHAGHVGEHMMMLTLGGQRTFHVCEVPGSTQAQSHTPMCGCGRLDPCGRNARSRETCEHARTRLRHRGASDGTMTDVGCALSGFCRDPDGLEAEVVWHKAPEMLEAGRPTASSSVPARRTMRSPSGTLVTSPSPRAHRGCHGRHGARSSSQRVVTGCRRGARSRRHPWQQSCPRTYCSP